MNQTELSNMTDSLRELYYSLMYSLGIAELGASGVVLLVGFIAAVVSLVAAFIIWILESLPISILARRNGKRCGWLAWIPIFGRYFRLFVLAVIPDVETPFRFLGIFTIRSRALAFWVYVGINVFGTALVNAIVVLINLLLPIIGFIAVPLSFIPWVITSIMEYEFLKDVLDVFKPSKRANRTASVIITVLDNLITFGFARLAYLLTLLRATPLDKEA